MPWPAPPPWRGGAPAEDSAGVSGDRVDASRCRAGRVVGDLRRRHRLGRLRGRGGPGCRLRAARSRLGRRVRRLGRVAGLRCRLRRMTSGRVMLVGRDGRWVLDLQAVRRGAGLAGRAGLRRLRRCRRRRRRVAGRRRRRCRVCRRNHGRLVRRGRRRCDLLGHLAGEVLRPLVLDVDAQDVRTDPALLGEGQGHERFAFLLVGPRLLEDAR